MTTFAPRVSRAEGRSERDAELRAAALLAMLERFAYLVTNRDLGWDDDTVLDTLERRRAPRLLPSVTPWERCSLSGSSAGRRAGARTGSWPASR